MCGDSMLWPLVYKAVLADVKSACHASELRRLTLRWWQRLHRPIRAVREVAIVTPKVLQCVLIQQVLFPERLHSLGVAKQLILHNCPAFATITMDFIVRAEQFGGFSCMQVMRWSSRLAELHAL